MAEQSTRTVERALSLLAAVSASGPTTLADAARAVDLSPSTALRLLRTLEASGFVRRDGDGGYRAGSRLIQLGAAALAGESLVDLAREPMVELSASTGESVYLSVVGHGETALYIGIVEGSHSVRHTNWVGRTVPLAGSAAGAALRGDVPAEGFVVIERGVERDVTAVAAPISAAGRIVAALSILVPSYRITPASAHDYGVLLADATHRLSADLTGGAHLPEDTHV